MLFGNRGPRSSAARRRGEFHPRLQPLEQRYLLAIDLGGVLPPGLPNVAFFGQTEMSPVTCVLDGEDAIRKLGSVGKPVTTVAVRIVDDAMNDVPRGEVGEIVYRGPSMMSGYWRNPQATAEACEGGWFHSGDLVR